MIEQEYIIYDVNKKIQKNIKAFGLEGFFVFTLLASLLFSFIILMILNTLLNVIVATLFSIIFFMLTGVVSTFLSKKYGIRNLMLLLGARKQAEIIICQSRKIKINNGNNVNNNK